MFSIPTCSVHGEVPLLPQEVEVLQGSPQRGRPARHPPLLCRLHRRECQGLRQLIDGQNGSSS